MKPIHPPPSIHTRAALLLVPSLLALAAAGGNSTAAWAGQKTVPFTASVVTQETVRPDPTVCTPPLYLTGSTSGSGVATQLGVINFVASDCITPGVPNYSFGNGKLTITAANGDELRATYSGTLTPLPNPYQFPLFTAAGHYTVTGGSGRFQGASGSGYLQGVENTQTGQGFFNLTGTLTY